MPYYYFDLVVDSQPFDQGGMILEDLAVASDKADALANELRMVKPELRDTQCYVRVMDENNQEIYRAPVGPVQIHSTQTSR